MQATNAQPIEYQLIQEQCRYYRIERQYASPRRLKEFVRDLLQAHCGT